jgi:2',3'-cyclic-nucleotide 2'-phosphodiesterase (5'-nucleotidase family)
MDYKTHGIKGATVSITSSVVSSKDDKTLAFIPHDGDTVSINELALIYRFSNNILCTVDMTPQQLYAWMSRVADKLMIDENGNAKIKPDQSIHGTDTFYGIDYTFDLTKPEGQRVVSAKIKGQNLLEMKEPVRVVLNTFRMAGAHSFYETTKLTEKDCAWNATDFHPEDEANVQSQLGEYVRHLKNVTPDQPTEYGYDSKWEVLTK